MPSVPRRSVVLDRVAKLVKGEEVSSINPFISEMTIGGRSLEAPMLVMADSYKAAHFAMYIKYGQNIDLGQDVILLMKLLQYDRNTIVNSLNLQTV